MDMDPPRAPALYQGSKELGHRMRSMAAVSLFRVKAWDDLWMTEFSAKQDATMRVL